jgi:hypothetical protein
MSATLPLRFGLAERHEFPLYPDTRKAPPEPVMVPWPLKPMGSADCGAERLPDGRLSYWIRHDVVRGVTPRMLVWWFSNLEGDIEVGGQRINRYRSWHPYDHVHASYVRRRADGSIGPGAQIRLREYLGANPAYDVDTITTIEKLDEEATSTTRRSSASAAWCAWSTRSSGCPRARCTRTACWSAVSPAGGVGSRR